MRGDPLNVHVEATSAFEDAYNAMQHYADCAAWCMCEARWVAELLRHHIGPALTPDRWDDGFPWEARMAEAGVL